MKHFFTLILAFCCYCSHANDTLTVGEVYNFNVGDTFDYRITTETSTFRYEHYTRQVVSAMEYSADMDTLIITYSNLDGSLSYDTINGLSQKAIYSIDSMFPNGCYYSYMLNDYSPFSLLPINKVYQNCFEYTMHNTYAYGLGKIDYYEGSQEGFFKSELIYFSNADTNIGIPYDIANGSHLVQFVPLPEECASWTRVIQALANSQTFDAIIEQIRTGNKVESNGRTYVELIYRCVNKLTNTFTTDSVLGYFYNDTLTKRIMFTTSAGTTGTVLYDFDLLNGAPCGLRGVLVVSTSTIGGQIRTTWNCNAIGGIPQISGVGGLSGLIRVRSHQFGANPNYGSLTCFSVCGEVLYPANNAKYCDLLTSIDEQFEESTFNLYPNPANRQITFNSNGATRYTGYTVYNVDGSVVMSGNIDAGAGTISTANFAKGVYYLNAYSTGGNSVSRRFIVAE